MNIESKTRRRTTWVLRGVVALVFLAAGVAKLVGAAPMVHVFDLIGVGQWFRLVTGAVEVGGALLLLLPRRGFWGATLLAITMACTVFTHLAFIGGNPAPAIVLLVLTGTIAYLLRPQALGAAPVGARS